MEEIWMQQCYDAPFQELGRQFDLDPLAIRLMRNRMVFKKNDWLKKRPDGRSEAAYKIDMYLHGQLKDISDPMLIKDMDRAVQTVLSFAREKKKIRVIGDYDIDGIMSTYILIHAIGDIGGDVDWRIPHRVKDGYGLNERLISEAADDGIRLLVTCDNGIAAKEQIAHGNALGLKTVVTDHHQVPFNEEDGEKTEILPPAEAVVDPHRADDTSPYNGLCGAGVAWKFALALYRQAGLPDAEKKAERFLTFAAIATVGDVMELTGENRIIVREGLKQIRRGCCPGLRELILQNNLDQEKIDVYHIGFVIGPCLNASGRLDTAGRALELLMTDSETEAAAKASELIALNHDRQAMTDRGTAEAIEQVNTTSMIHDRVLVIFLKDSHVSVVGIIAGKVKECFNRPTFVVTEVDGMIRGSGRSIEAYSMYEELVSCDDLLTAYGGHPMAAGISLKPENLEAFRRRLNENCTLTEGDMKPVVRFDAEMPLTYMTKKRYEDTQCLWPTGNGNPKALFARRGVKLYNARILGKRKIACRIDMEDPADRSGRMVQGIYFGQPEDVQAFCGRASEGPVTILYEVQLNEFRGIENLQFLIHSYR